MNTRPEPGNTQGAPDVQLPATSSPRKLLTALLTPLFMALMGISVVNVALTPIGHSLNAGSS